MINIYNIFARMIFRGFLLAAFLLFCCISLIAQAPPSYNSSDILHRIQKLKVLGTALYVAAHPDDENTRLLAWLSKDQQLKTGYLSITRGDGGQNLIGDEQGVELGLIRTQELLAARRVDGAEQFFTRAFDFGYSKSTEEALRLWGKKDVLGDVVWIIRKFQPDVIITRFPADNRAGHGHHSASAALATEAFTVAADKNAYTEQFKYGVKPWQAKRILWNSYVFGSINTTSEKDMKIEVGGFNPLLGKSYGEISADSRSQHKSQGFGVASSRGSQLEYFSFIKGSKPQKSITEGVNTSWSRIGAAHISTSIDRILGSYDPAYPARSVNALVSLYQGIGRLPDSFWKQEKLNEIKEIIAAASGLWMEAFATKPFAVKGDSLTINVSLNNRNGSVIRFIDFAINDNHTNVNKSAASNVNIDFKRSLIVQENIAVSQPYWLRNKMNVGSFNISKQELIGKPESPTPYYVTFTVNVNGQDFSYSRPVQYKHTDPVKGEMYQPLIVRPEPSEESKYGVLKHISYSHIPDVYYFNRDSVNIDLSDVKIAGKKVGYIEGAGDKVPEALARMGYNVVFLKEKDITAAYLKQFDAVITGVRAYNVHRWLSARNEELNNYVRNGGNLVVQYNTNSFVGPNTSVIGPVKFDISRERITDEHSPVRFVLPQHQVLNYPNKITTKDFENWVQERGIYFAEKMDSSFQTPLAMTDPGEKEKVGGLIIADYGKGKFVYTGLVFFRQLPSGVTGAYRLLANIIALNKNPE